MSRTKQSAKRMRVNLASNTPPPQAQQPTSASYPWPRKQVGEPIDLNSPMLLDFNCEGWDKETAGRYNSLLRVDILPTSFGHAETLADLGIDEDVFETLQAMGIAPLCYQEHELYPDLARQVLSTATITYEDSSAPSYANCSFSFMADGEYCSLSLDKLKEIYEIANEPRGVAVAKKFAPSNAFWDFIANGNFTPGKAYQSQIRNPALRVTAKFISNLLFAKDQTSKVTNGELQTLYTCIEDEIRASGSGIPIQKDVEDITTEDDPSYDLGELADVTDDQAYQRWMVDSQRKNNSLMRRILHLVTGGCIGGSNQRQSPAAQTPRPHRPGKEPIACVTGDEFDFRFLLRVGGWCELSLGKHLSSQPIRLHWVDSTPPNLNLILTEILLVMGTRSGKQDLHSGLLTLFTNLADPEWLAHL
uniref:Arabidopsis retrotransposon Orf1 C-terminal domain-containing protein n=1 Tax=Brassica oleracea TaxID=3712 RepID=A0A3P6GMS4_BRAOL|nr:unnamed protein product [Brassica oleracea]